MSRARPLHVVVTPRTRDSPQKNALKHPIPICSNRPLPLVHCPVPLPNRPHPLASNDRHRHLSVGYRYSSSPCLRYPRMLTPFWGPMSVVSVPVSMASFGRLSINLWLLILVVLLTSTTPETMTFTPCCALTLLAAILCFSAPPTFRKLARYGFPSSTKHWRNSIKKGTRENIKAAYCWHTVESHHDSRPFDTRFA